MAKIQVLSEDTIDKIAAGEVVERPMSVVKELVENAMDAFATAVTVEIKNGGIDFIRVTDNGKGMEADQVKIAFFRHATSKIRSVEDLSNITSMGFRGEALSSVVAVAQVELITKTKEALTGTRYVIEGAAEKEFEEVGAPDGTTFLVKNLFFNTPVRRKFLKQPQTEAGYVAELLERLALARPDISFKYIQNGQVKFSTPGNGDLKEVIYRIYGREIANHLIPVKSECEGIKITGFLGKPEINRSTRGFEHYFINARYIKSKVLAKAIEDGYKQYVMQHKFPFVVLHFEMSGKDVDVNVHPTKMEVRFSEEQRVYQTVTRVILDTFRSKELIVEAAFGREEKKDPETVLKPVLTGPAISKPALTNSGVPAPEAHSLSLAAAKKPVLKPFVMDFPSESMEPEKTLQESKLSEIYTSKPMAADEAVKALESVTAREASEISEPEIRKKPQIIVEEASQETLFTEQFLSEKAKESYEILGQVFGTYWLVAYKDKLYMIDQHAAHEKVKYERLVAARRQKEVLSQSLMPPVVLQTSAREEQVLLDNLETFASLGFELEEFGDHSFCLRGVPVDLYGVSYEQLFKEVLDEILDGGLNGTPEVVADKLASMACKAAVKGNNVLSRTEAKKLIDELLTLENPYHCPHGRPTIISMSRQEIEKKFKRIV